MRDDFRFGNGRACCAKPVGCMMHHGGCMYLKHPWKRAMIFGDQTVRCQAKSYPPDPAFTDGRTIEYQCVLLNGHDGRHDPAPALGEVEQ